jgi:hypothetical protein
MLDVFGLGLGELRALTRGAAADDVRDLVGAASVER